MKRASQIRIRFASALVALMLPALGCLEPTFDSRRLDREITVDGTAPEWAGAEAYYDQQDAFKLGFFNDDEYLYVYFATWSLSTQRLIRASGFTIWLDEKGGKSRTFGIEYPRGRSAFAGGTVSGPPEGSPEGAPDEPPDGAGGTPGSLPRGDPGRLAAELNRMRHEALIKSPAGDSVMVWAVDDGGDAGIRAMLNARSRLLVIEMRIPLDRTGASPYAIEAAPGDVIGIGFETGTLEMAKRMRSQEMPPDEMPGGRMPGEGGMPPGGMRPGEPPREVSLWAKVKLAP